MAVTGGETRDPEPAADTIKGSPKSDQPDQPSSQETSGDLANPETRTPEQEAGPESEERIMERSFETPRDAKCSIQSRTR